MKNKNEKDFYSDQSPLSVYRRAIQIMGMDAVHDAIAKGKGGIDILRRGVPFVVRGARYKQLDKYRKKSGRELPTDKADELEAPRSIWDPYEQVERNDTLRIITEALAELSDEDVIAVWDHFEGYSDKEIQKKWIELKIGPQNPEISLIRKRRERALKRLKPIIKERLLNINNNKV